MCNLTDNFNGEEMMNDPEYLKYLEQQHKEMEEYLDWYIKSLEEKVERDIDPYENTHLIHSN